MDSASAGELQRESRLSDARLTRDEHQLVATIFRPLPRVLHLPQFGFASDEVNRSGCKQRRR